MEFDHDHDQGPKKLHCTYFCIAKHALQSFLLRIFCVELFCFSLGYLGFAGGGLGRFGGRCTEQGGGTTGDRTVIFACNYFCVAIIFALQLFLHCSSFASRDLDFLSLSLGYLASFNATSDEDDCN